MGTFEYLSVLVSIVLGLGLTHLLSSVAQIVHRRATIRLYRLHVAWAVNVGMLLVYFWWIAFTWNRLGDGEWSIPLFLFVLLYGVVIYLLVALLFPEGGVESQDFEYQFFRDAPWFFGALILAGALDLADTWIKGRLGILHDLAWAPYGIFVGSWIVLGSVATRSTSRWFHKLFALWYFGWMVWLLLGWIYRI